MELDEREQHAQLLVELQKLLVGPEEVGRIRLVLARYLNDVRVILFEVIPFLE